VNKDAGRDHWGQAASMLFWGAGVKEGFVLGKTDKHGGYPTQRPVAPADVCYTILDAMGIDPRKQLVTPDGRPIEILDQGEAMREIFA
jgi:arylsulfatase A-like enzyme